MPRQAVPLALCSRTFTCRVIIFRFYLDLLALKVAKLHENLSLKRDKRLW
ncbi:DEAD-box ATP-dependent RNA helicase 28-like [Pyrus ussuriensis x Pyrus communis]|uniref:DEAD-box ATP-dependent RNA helicase 28-like n=1 Tax=Pyrus ussuriensis x Pyrus communis TaxID=2448454 RepID=A0A5N5FC50_9ROSA|nr:DEAD-box ATP-dependent RNA helicase 28-like [Pyrus ussuriensis x Pyrus communis]